MNIGDLFLRIIAATDEFDADLKKKAAKAGDEAGKTLGERMGSSIKANAAKLIGGALALAGGIAAKGILELQNITADFRAETGATADEAERAGKAINEMSGRNIQPMNEIGAALIKVHKDLGLTGDEAERITERFLKFGRATKQEASSAVAAFDDILDAWNLTAADSGPIMDALVVSNQRYGGAIADDEAALRDLAPALIAANQTWEDGLALINLFKDSGADAAVAVAGITKALGKVSSPEELQHLIADIIATEDPFLRAAKATDLFGAKAGPKLANVLKPGIAGLDAYVISAKDAEGATTDAAEVLDSTWGARFQLLIKKAGSAIIGFGNDWGGLATVIATTMTIAGNLGGRLAGPITHALTSAWNLAAGSPLVKKAVAFASGKAVTVYLTGLIAGDAIGGALTKAWAATGGRVLAAAGISGAAAGRAFALGAAAAIAAAPVVVFAVAMKIQGDIDRQGEALKQQAAEFVKTATDADLEKAIAGVQKQLDGMVFNTLDSKNKVIGVLNVLIAEANERAGQGAAALNTVTDAADALDQDAGKSFQSVGEAAARMKQIIATNAGAIAESVKNLTATLLGEATAMINGYYDPIIAQDELRVEKDTVAAATIARNATKAGTAARHEADLTLANAKKNLDQTRLNLLAAGALSAKEQKTWLSELQAKYKTATGDARAKIGALIAKIHELQNVPSTVVKITLVQATQDLRERAMGGPVKAGHPYLVNENTPNSEIWVPEVSGRVLGPSATPVSGLDTPGSRPISAPQVTIYNPEPRAAEEDVSRTMRRLAALGF